MKPIDYRTFLGIAAELPPYSAGFSANIGNGFYATVTNDKGAIQVRLGIRADFPKGQVVTLGA